MLTRNYSFQCKGRIDKHPVFPLISSESFKSLRDFPGMRPISDGGLMRLTRFYSFCISDSFTIPIAIHVFRTFFAEPRSKLCIGSIKENLIAS